MSTTSAESPGASDVPRSRRDEILSIAAQQFADRGVAGTTVRDIGSAAGILSGSLYHHFESKEQMVAELLLPVMERQIGQYRLIVARDGSAAATLRETTRRQTCDRRAGQLPAQLR